MRRTRRMLGAAVLAALLAAPLALTVPADAHPAQAGSCAGFKNRPGMTDKVIRIGNSVDRSGPVPGLYLGARQAVRAYVAYFSSTRRICGRKLVLDTFDSQTDAGGDQTAYQAMCTSDFASVGSMSAFDNGGASTAQSCRLPDLRVRSSSNARNLCTTCFGVEATRAGEGVNSVPDFIAGQRPAAVQKAAILYLNAGTAPAQASTLEKVDQARGFTYVYSAAIDVADLNYGPYVQQLKNHGVRVVRFVGAPTQTARLAMAMQSASFTPDVFLAGPSAYDPQYPSLAGVAGNGTIVPIDFLPLTSNQGELKLYRSWLAKVAPHAAPTPAGLFAWSAAKLFTQQAVSLGGNLSRVSLIARLRTVTAWTGGGSHAPMAVGAKQLSPCARLLQLHSGHWSSIGGTAYRCHGITKVG